MNNFYGKRFLCLFLTEKKYRAMKITVVMLTPNPNFLGNRDFHLLE
jgi:hypothetical protein